MPYEYGVQQFLGDLRSIFSDLSRLPIPTISAVSSVALGGGLELALVTTLRVFSSTATLGLPEVRLGIIPGAGGTYRLNLPIGKTKALKMILTGYRISGDSTYQWGLCEWIALPKSRRSEEEQDGKDKAEDLQRVTRQIHDNADEDGMETPSILRLAIDVAEDIRLGGPGAVGATLNAVTSATLRSENEMYKRCTTMGERDRQEALIAFKEKRKPRFEGVPVEVAQDGLEKHSASGHKTDLLHSRSENHHG